MDLKEHKLKVADKKFIKKELDALKRCINTNKVKGIFLISFTDTGWGTAKLGIVPGDAVIAALDKVKFEVQIEILEQQGAITINPPPAPSLVEDSPTPEPEADVIH